jgi:hypothetical protein
MTMGMLAFGFSVFDVCGVFALFGFKMMGARRARTGRPSKMFDFESLCAQVDAGAHMAMAPSPSACSREPG